MACDLARVTAREANLIAGRSLPTCSTAAARTGQTRRGGEPGATVPDTACRPCETDERVNR